MPTSLADALDVLTPAGLRTGEILPRDAIHRLGKPHRAVHIYLLNSHGDLLIHRRADSVDHYPGAVCISVVGHVNAGESSSHAARRELAEELGLDPRAVPLDYQFSHYREATLSPTYIDRQFNDVYLARADLDPSALHPDPGEIAEIHWVSLDAFGRMIDNHDPSLAPVYADEFRDLRYFLAASR